MGSGLYLECANIFLDNTTIPNGISNVSGSEFQIQIFRSCQGPCRHFESAGRPIFFRSGRVLLKKMELSYILIFYPPLKKVSGLRAHPLTRALDLAWSQLWYFLGEVWGDFNLCIKHVKNMSITLHVM